MSGESWPANLDGNWDDHGKDEHGYRRFRAGPVEVRGFEDYEPNGELVTHEPVEVHIERMDEDSWWIGLSWGKSGHVSVDFYSATEISVMWHDDRMLPGEPSAEEAEELDPGSPWNIAGMD